MAMSIVNPAPITQQDDVSDHKVPEGMKAEHCLPDSQADKTIRILVDKVKRAPIAKQRPKKYKSRKVKKQVTLCEHTEEKYYSRGLCKNCYHKSGRVKLATDCPHSDRKLYARKVCKGCYLRIFFRGHKAK